MLLTIENKWIKMRHQIEFLNSVWDEFDSEYQVHQNGVLRVLQGKLQAAISIVDGLQGDAEEQSSLEQVMRKKGDIKRIKYAVNVKGRLKRAIEELKEWHSMFDPSWFLMISVRNPSIDERLSEQPSVHSGPLSALKGLRDAVRAQPEIESSTRSLFYSSHDVKFKQTPIQFSY